MKLNLYFRDCQCNMDPTTATTRSNGTNEPIPYIVLPAPRVENSGLMMMRLEHGCMDPNLPEPPIKARDMHFEKTKVLSDIQKKIIRKLNATYFKDIDTHLSKPEYWIPYGNCVLCKKNTQYMIAQASNLNIHVCSPECVVGLQLDFSRHHIDKIQRPNPQDRSINESKWISYLQKIRH